MGILTIIRVIKQSMKICDLYNYTRVYIELYNNNS